MLVEPHAPHKEQGRPPFGVEVMLCIHFLHVWTRRLLQTLAVMNSGLHTCIRLAIPKSARVPKAGYPPLRIVRFFGSALTQGIEDHIIDGVPVRVTSVPKAVVDCFKYRNKIGLDVALEALHEAWRAKRVTMDELWHFAAMCRVANVMRPYLESLP